jgi:3-isopropylmalate dehydrogenase
VRAVITLLPGDGVGPEVMAEAVKVLNAIAKRHGHDFQYREGLIGATAIDTTGSPLPDSTLRMCLEGDAVLLIAVGDPRFDDPSLKVRPEQGLLALRKGLAVFANLRPARVSPYLLDASTIKPDVLTGVDLLVVRELTGGIYFGQPRYRDSERAVDTMAYSAFEIERVVRMAFERARGRRRRVTSVDKANILECSRLWRQVSTRVAADYPDVALQHMLVDTAAMRLVRAPGEFDVIVTENTFGDILTDEASMIVGSMGMLPSASLGEGRRGLYEPVHGSAPDIAGQGIANPLASILSVAMLLRYSLGLEAEARSIEAAVDAALGAGYRTKDIMQEGKRLVGTREMGDTIVERLTGFAPG